MREKTLVVAKDGLPFALRGRERGWTVKLDFGGSHPEVPPEGRGRRQAVISYFKGPEKDWKTGLPTFAKVVYKDPGPLDTLAGSQKLPLWLLAAPPATRTSPKQTQRSAPPNRDQRITEWSTLGRESGPQFDRY